ncbi:Mobile element protein [Candidatus Enterovibrio altilux]|uniref:Mobile element protein n=1 Tax=Candidatus Enterovibrio altilux TaxID=1927128 RepID=A0A291BA64_9GAMM|nr:Mobile element protein [Candidatus Enterovibrio luxaltus]
MNGIIAAEFSVSNVTASKVLPNLLKSTHRKINETSGNSAYNAKKYYKTIHIKRTVLFIPPRKEATGWE